MGGMCNDKKNKLTGETEIDRKRTFGLLSDHVSSPLELQKKIS